MRTITQASNELGVARRKIYEEIEKLQIKVTKEGRNSCLSDHDYLRIELDLQQNINVQKERLNNVLERDRYTNSNNISDREYTDLKERISSLEQQIKIKDEQIQTKDEQLQAKDYQLNGLIQSNLNITKALNPPRDEMAATTIEPERKSFWSRVFSK